MLRLAFLILCLASPLTALAAPGGADEARLRGVIERLISGQKQAFEKTGGSFVTTGQTIIEQAGSYYAVTLPDITLIHPNKSQTALGLIALNASPASATGWNITMALPTPIVTKAADGSIDSQLSFGKQHFTGLWDEKFQNFTSLKTLYENVTLNLPGNNPDKPFSSASIRKMGYGFDLADTTQAKTDLTFRLGLEGMSAQQLSPAYKRLFPTDATANIDLKDLPMDRLGDIQKGIMTPDKMTGSPLWITELLAQAGSEAIINAVHIKNETSSANLTGRLKPAPTTPLKHTGNLVLDITRIDQILLGLNETAGTLPIKEQGALQGIRVALTMMGALGQNVTANGVEAKRFNVELTPTGQVMMNGTDFSALLQAGGIKPAGTKAAR